jgi:type VI secretion system protein ImpM
MDASTPGFYGKLPSLGDFVSRRLERTFIDPWDAWLQAAVATSRTQMGEGWLDTYLTSPLWRFVLSPGICGPECWTGVMMPSCDRVGRYFPLAVVAPLPEAVNPFTLATVAGEWHAKVEELMLSTLERDDLSASEFDAEVEGLGTCAAPAESTAVDPAAAGALSSWRLSLPGVDGIGAGYHALLNHLVHLSSPAYSLWWTSGSAVVAPTLLVSSGLPPASGYCALLDGQWQTCTWDESGGAVPPA